MVQASIISMLARGQQDDHFTANPQQSIFKLQFKRITLFAVETQEHNFQGQISFGKHFQTRVIKSGDLIKSYWIQINTPGIAPDTANGATATHWTNDLTRALIKSITMLVGGNPVDKMYGEYIHMYDEFFGSDETDMDEYTFKYYTQKALIAKSAVAQTLWFNAGFWFEQHPGSGMAFPLAALQYQEVDFKIETNPLSALFVNEGNKRAIPLNRATGKAITDHDFQITSYVTYFILSDDERLAFARSNHEYVMRQHQVNYGNVISGSNTRMNAVVRHEIYGSHPVEFSFVALQADEHQSNNQHFHYGVPNGGHHPISAMNIFYNYNPLHPNAMPTSWWHGVLPKTLGLRQPRKNVYIIANNINPKSLQYNGSANYSKLEDVLIEYHVSRAALNQKTPSGANVVYYPVVHFRNLNIMRFKGGLAGPSYAS